MRPIIPEFLSFLLLLTLCTTSRAQTNSSGIDVLPHWQKNDTHKVKLKTTTTDIDAGDHTQKTYISTFEATFTVLSANAEGYTIAWTYTNANLDKNEPVLESQTTALLVNVKMILSLSNTGKILELVNADEVKTAADKQLAQYAAGKTPNEDWEIRYKTIKQMLSTTLGIRLAFLKQIEFYNHLFGYNYQLHHVQTRHLKFPNPMGGQPFDAIEKTDLTRLDKSRSVCTIEASKTVEGNTLKQAVIDYMLQVIKLDPKIVDNGVSNAEMALSEKIKQEFDFSKGIPQHFSFERKISLSFLNRTSVLDITTIN